ncbi:beta-aspartyl-peptidase [Clostridium botulinum]|uniref:beta-aspartyl-peptidase n=1 Tax=Clostridium sp. ZS1 TaxID=2949989 RepID=UPI0013C8E2B3|nr:beta-aspartyl-peptidase [Clostridium sp. ZS1]NFG42240.1 beta-aspartyl-peptidase [Clostridium botulinum]NFI93003.1 beta-aspartyl-peptidase [Clostridium botulinum]NFO91533.1 beta-aspartyl-peptidase [Clostridium botulinum]
MISIIKDIKVYSPEYIGIKDIVIAGGKIEGIYENLDISNTFIEVNVIDGKNKIIFPGFIDSHVHLIGGGGEGGYKTRTPELQLSNLTSSGITTVVGCIGTDSECRGIKSLIAKVKSLKEEGLSSYCYTGSYAVPVKTLTGFIERDIMLIQEIIGVGEIALSDNRSSEPTYEDFAKLVAQSRLGGILSSKSGVVNVHIGEGKRKLDYLFKLINESDIPSSQLLPTHINRNTNLFMEGLRYVKEGGLIDLTTSSDVNFLEEGELTASEGLKKYIEAGLPIENITFSSDGNGSMPKFDKNKKIVGLGICSVESLYLQVKEGIKKYGIPIETAIKVITSNVADILKLYDKGRIEKGKDADLVIVDENSLDIDIVLCNGIKMVQDGECIVRGTFE